MLRYVICLRSGRGLIGSKSHKMAKLFGMKTDLWEKMNGQLECQLVLEPQLDV